MTTEHSIDPVTPDWASLSLAPTWADDINFTRPGGWLRFARSIMGKPQPVRLSPNDPMARGIPKYALQEFHNLPNGNYSHRISRGYITGFDRMMLGHMAQQRRIMAQQLADCDAALDVGTGGGKLAAALVDAGVTDVWGVDVSPYMLKHAATDFPEVKFYQAPAERLPFCAERFDAVTVSFLFHEMPPKYIARALAEIHRVLRPGGRLLVAEPSARQLGPIPWRQLMRRAGWRHIYFKRMAARVHEPFIKAWHGLDKQALFAQAGFCLNEHSDQVPINYYSLKKHSSAATAVVG